MRETFLSLIAVLCVSTPTQNIMQRVLGVAMLLAVAALALSGAGDVYQVTSLEDRPGLYYESMGPAQLQQADWRVTLYVEVNKFRNTFPTDGDSLDQVYHDCQQRNPASICQALIRIDYLKTRLLYATSLVEELAMLARKKEILGGRMPPSIRKRSVPFGIVGSLSRSLFGTLNEEDASYIHSQIDRLFHDQTEITKIAEKQMHIVSANLQALKQEQINEARRVKKILDITNGVYREISDFENGYSIIQYNLTLINYSNRVEDKIEKYVRACQVHLEIIFAALEGRLDPAAISAGQLKEIAKDAQAHIGRLELPIAHDHLFPRALAPFVKTDVVSNGDRIVIVAHIPLLDRDAFELYRLHSWPVPQRLDNETRSAYVTPSAPYLAVAMDSRRYFYATEDFRAGCRDYVGRFVCPGAMPVHDLLSAEACEVLMLLHPSEDNLKKCRIHLTSGHQDFWKYMPSQGGWLYSVSGPVTVRVSCSEVFVQETRLEGAGILHLQPHCVGITRTTTLLSPRVYAGGEIFIYQPGLSLNVSIMAPALQQRNWSSVLSVTFSEPSEEDPLRRIVNIGENDEVSLRELEQRLQEIGSHRRDKESLQILSIASLVTQACLLFGLGLYLARSKISSWLAPIAKLFGGGRGDRVGMKTDTVSTPRPIRSPDDSEGGESSGTRELNLTPAPRSVPRQEAQVP